MNYELNIRDEYIQNIYSGDKKHEYRLNDDKLRNLTTDDTLTLISSYNKINSVVVKVKRVVKCSSWREALIDDWVNDFKGIFKTLEEAIETCSTFYSKDLIGKYGILKIEIEPINELFLDYDVLGIKRVKFKDINLKDEFFNSLREDYDFDDWFIKKSNRGEYAYVYYKDDNIAGFLYLKKEIEKDNGIQPCFEEKTRLKIGTFKIDSKKAKGFRLGERFLKIVFDNALLLNVDEIYITLFENKRDEVKALANKYLARWGFKKWGYKISNNESVFVKNMKMHDSLQTVQFNFPTHKKGFKMFFLPILSKYHTKLFPDMILKTEEKEKFNKEYGSTYSLSKIYVSSVTSKALKVKPGDIVVIYRTGDEGTYKKYSSVCTGLAIIESIFFPNTIDEYLKLCSNKTVFDNMELRTFYNIKKYRTVIKLIPLKTYNNKIILKTLRAMNICSSDSGPRPLDEIYQEFKNYFYYNK